MVNILRGLGTGCRTRESIMAAVWCRMTWTGQVEGLDSPGFVFSPGVCFVRVDRLVLTFSIFVFLGFSPVLRLGWGWVVCGWAEVVAQMFSMARIVWHGGGAAGG